MIEIPDTELMAEKLGMIVLCDNCGKRLKRVYAARIPTWQHEETDDYWCPMRKVDGRCITGILDSASPRSGPLADQYEMESQ